MKAVLLLSLLIAVSSLARADSLRERKLLDFGWRFHLGNAADPTLDFGFGTGVPFAKAGEAIGAVKPSFNDSGWRQINVPHDWVVEEDFVPGGDGLHNAHGYKPSGRAYPANAVGWYRRTFDIPETDKGRRLSVEFDGVFRDSHVWLNGHLLGRETSGYSSFAYDITDFVNYGGRNTLVVRADASHYEGWFYEGGGIYRHVWLVKTSPVHIAHWGTYVTSEVKGDSATVMIRTELVNDSDGARTVILSSGVTHEGQGRVEDKREAITLAPWSRETVAQRLKVASPAVWSIEHPNLYQLSSQLAEGPTPQDQTETTFGIRTIHFDPNNGFFLNGKHVVIKGTCNHQDHAGVGSALPDRIQYYRIEKLKEMGCNAYRTSHNPPTPELLDACDRLGMLVMDENRLMDSSTDVLSQLESLVKRDRNHPSVILWSIGNEEFEGSSERGGRIAQTMCRLVHKLDPTRPTTYAGNNGETFTGPNSVVDVRGFNYVMLGDDLPAEGPTDRYHAAHPAQPVMGSEEASTLSTRGEYANNPVKGYMSAYDTERPGWGSTAEHWWTYFAERPYLAGAFVWTGFDYRGEPTPYEWPCISSHFGVLDTCGFFKDNAYYYQAWWGTRPMIHLLPHWNWEGSEGKEISVWCYSNLNEVELVLNGKSLGRKPVPRNSHLEWKAPYAAGTLEARGFHNGKVVMIERVETTGAPSRIVLTPDRTTIAADNEDVSMVTVSVVDSKGRVVPLASNDISLSAEGGEIIGVGNGDPSSHEKDKFAASSYMLPVDGWTMKAVTGLEDPALFATDWPDAKNVTITGSATQMPSNSFAGYRATFELTSEALAENPKLSIGQIDDLSWVYVNGKLVGETKDWNASFKFDVGSLLRVGTNSIVILVRNNAGQGGLGGGVSLGYVKPAQGWHRKVFHGLGQVIVQSGRKVQTIKLKASAPGLEGATVEIKTKAADFRGL